RHLGATYYKTIHGDATAMDVARALENAEEHDTHGHQPHWTRRRHPRTGRWRVSDVMRTDVITVDKTASYKQVAKVMSDHMVNAVPVLTKERQLRRLGTGLPPRTRHERAQAEGRTAAELMTAPDITIHPDAPVGVAARLM